MIRSGYMRRLRIKFIIVMGGCELKFRILLTIKNTILLTFVPACYVGREGIAGPKTDKIEELIHASSHINDTFNFACTCYSSFFDDTFDFTCTFHIDDATTSTSCFGDDTTSTS
jgi:hypothetical protein